MINVLPLNCSAIIVSVVDVLPNPHGKNNPMLGVDLAFSIKLCWYWCRFDLLSMIFQIFYSRF